VLRSDEPHRTADKLISRLAKPGDVLKAKPEGRSVLKGAKRRAD
jgi:hypothetical protein